MSAPDIRFGTTTAGRTVSVDLKVDGYSRRRSRRA
jgi:hypothetical protein